MKLLRIFGHPLHAAINDIPIGLWVAAAGWQWLAAVGGSDFWWAVSFWCLFIGLVAAIPVSAAGLHDYVGIPRERPGARSCANRHAAAMIAAGVCFAGSLWGQAGPNPPDSADLPLTLLLATAGLLFLGIGAWYGAELVFRHGIGRVYEPYKGPERRSVPRELV